MNYNESTSFIYYPQFIRTTKVLLIKTYAQIAFSQAESKFQYSFIDFQKEKWTTTHV
jgi:hypothetical protein